MSQRITYMGSQVWPKQRRTKKGRFAKKTRWTLYLIVFTALLIWGFAPQYNKWLSKEIEVTNISPMPVAMAAVTTQAKLDELKETIVNDLGACETQGVNEPDATILLDSNSQMSIGNWQWQIKSVQHYVKQFEGRDISRVEAIQIAVDHDKAKALTEKVLFGENGGWKNWYNCGQKLQLDTKINLINSLEN